MTPQQIESSAAFGKDCGRIKEAIYFLLNVRDYLFPSYFWHLALLFRRNAISAQVIGIKWITLLAIFLLVHQAENTKYQE